MDFDFEQIFKITIGKVLLYCFKFRIVDSREDSFPY